MIHGKDLIVAIAGEGAIAASKSCSVNVQQNFIDVCAPTEGRTKEKRPTDYSWSVDVDCLCVNTEDSLYFLNALKNGTALDLRWFVGGIKQGGKAYVSSWKHSGSVGSLETFSLSFVGSGPMLDKTSEGWDFHHGTLYTYSNFADGTLDMGGTLTDGQLEHASES